MTSGATENPDFGLSDHHFAARELPYRAGLLAGSTVLVTGAGGGLGRAMSWTFARLGAQLIVSGRDPDKLERIAADLAGAGHEVHRIVCNIRRHEETEALYAEVAERFGSLDLLVNNAGGQFPQAAIDFSPKGWHAVVETNLTGTWNMMQGAARLWREAGTPGSIVNIVSVTDRGQPGVAHTCAARAGIVALTRTVAVEWAPYRIRINCVAPGAIATDGQKVYSEEARQRSRRSNPMLRFGDAADIADAVVFLGGPTGKFITGETLDVDGGGKLWGEFFVAGRPAYFDE